MFDDVLFNRKPPYGMPGGVKDALLDTGGEVYGITNSQAAAARRLFEQSEEIDILNAPAIAVAALEQAVESGTIPREETVLLNITGGGVSRMIEDHSLQMIRPQKTVSSWEQAAEFLEGKR